MWKVHCDDVYLKNNIQRIINVVILFKFQLLMKLKSLIESFVFYVLDMFTQNFKT